MTTVLERRICLSMDRLHRPPIRSLYSTILIPKTTFSKALIQICVIWWRIRGYAPSKTDPSGHTKRSLLWKQIRGCENKVKNLIKIEHLEAFREDQALSYVSSVSTQI
ncbi:hypothetical protein L596_029443 [Steinernema carpocapsae]|uniref:Uncharacterized protein n=1 Tax=Steinernema carpocapsae TaxID=34508 RepID=A0A4U5LUP0_STECR|nr:hypothetical protein L596_029443 [Steinernema carpocapsae]